jgi:hypothetical protein
VHLKVGDVQAYDDDMYCVRKQRMRVLGMQRALVSRVMILYRSKKVVT